MPEISRHQIEMGVPALERAITELDKAGCHGAAMNLGPLLVCLKAIGGWYDKPVRRRIRSSRPIWLDTL